MINSPEFRAFVGCLRGDFKLPCKATLQRRQEDLYAKVQLAGVLRQPVATRWGSKVDLLESLVANRPTVEHALGRLRHEKFRNDEFTAMTWIWLNTTWDDFEQVLKVGLELRIYLMRSHGATVGESVHAWLQVRTALENVFADLPQRLRDQCDTATNKRDSMILSEYALAGYVLDHRYRGQDLTPARLRKTFVFMQNTACGFLAPNMRPPTFDNYMEWVDGTGPWPAARSFFKDETPPQSFWALFKEHSLYPLARLLAPLPASTASVERLWSAAGWLQDGRSSLTAAHFHKEVYVRWNAQFCF